MHKDKTLQSYDATAHKYAQNVADLHPDAQAQKFKQLLKEKGTIIDLGCGSGRDVKIFSEQGFRVVGVDFSPKMIELAKETAPLADFYVMDLESLNFPDETFDGAWANASLLHIEKKKIPIVLNGIYKILKPGGYLFLHVKKGEGETFEKDKRYDGLEKFWSFFQEGELDPMLKKTGFHIVEQFLNGKRSSYETHSYINIFCQKLI